MKARTRIILGSFIGAVAIHGAMIACSTPMMGHDGGPDQDVLITDASLIDTAVDAVREAATDALSMETGTAEAGGGDGGMDGSTGTCTCPTLPTPPRYTFNWTANDRPGTNISSHAQVEVRQYPAGSQLFLPGTPEPVTQVIARVTAWVPRGPTQTWPSLYADVVCSIYVDSTGALYNATAGCQLFEHDNPTINIGGGSPAVTLVTFNDTAIEFRIASFPSASMNWPTFTNMVFRASDPSAHYTNPGGDLVP